MRKNDGKKNDEDPKRGIAMRRRNERRIESEMN